jgi:hypothetical protein
MQPPEAAEPVATPDTVTDVQLGMCTFDFTELLFSVAKGMQFHGQLDLWRPYYKGFIRGWVFIIPSPLFQCILYWIGVLVMTFVIG